MEVYNSDLYSQWGYMHNRRLINAHFNLFQMGKNKKSKQVSLHLTRASVFLWVKLLRIRVYTSGSCWLSSGIIRAISSSDNGDLRRSTSSFTDDSTSWLCLAIKKIKICYFFLYNSTENTSKLQCLILPHHTAKGYSMWKVGGGVWSAKKKAAGWSEKVSDITAGWSAKASDITAGWRHTQTTLQLQGGWFVFHPPHLRQITLISCWTWKKKHCGVP